jgi:hypothetical protein
MLSASTDSDNDNLGFAWDFDSDGIVDASGPIATHIWTQTGRSISTLIVYDGKGGAESLVVELAVLAASERTIWTWVARRFNQERKMAASLETIAVNTMERYVRIQLAGINDLLSLAEVPVLEDLI